MAGPFAELPPPKHKDLKEDFDDWLLAAHELSTDPAVALRERLYARSIMEGVQRMPHNNPARRSILQLCAQDVAVKHVAEDFRVSAETVYASLRDDNNFLVDLKYTPGVTRKRVSDGDLEVAMLFMNEHFPITSGRDFRVVSITYDLMYVIYVTFCQDRCVGALGKTCFMEKVIAPLKIHHTTDSAMCKICKKLERLQNLQVRTQAQDEELAELYWHQSIWREQCEYYRLRKHLLAHRSKQEEIIIVQDFTQLQVQGTFYQDLIIAAYFYNENVVGRLACEVTHYVASSSREKNDVNFVIRAWANLIISGYFDNYKMITVFSDGAGKHFKATSMMTFMGWLKKTLKVELEYNFFESNHGHNVCDAAAAAAKRAINVYQRDTGIAVRTPEKIVDVIVTIKNFMALVCPQEPSEAVPEFETFKKIRTARKFLFNDTHAFGYERSRDGFDFASWPMDFTFYDNLDFSLAFD